MTDGYKMYTIANHLHFCVSSDINWLKALCMYTNNHCKHDQHHYVHTHGALLLVLIIGSVCDQ